MWAEAFPPGSLSGGEPKGKNQPQDKTFLLCRALRVSLLSGRPCTQITRHRTTETSVFFLGPSQHPVHEASGNTWNIERAPFFEPHPGGGRLSGESLLSEWMPPRNTCVETTQSTYTARKGGGALQPSPATHKVLLYAVSSRQTYNVLHYVRKHWLA